MADRDGRVMQKLKVLDLFSGIGGFSLGLERTGGFKTVAFCEIEEFPRKVLAKHWPDVPCFPDVTKLDGGQIGERVDVIAGGFPCQDISSAGKKQGITGDRSSLFSEIIRLVREIRPSYVIMENSAELLNRGAPDVFGQLAESGYDCEWLCIPASALGAPHGRDRIWIVAYANDKSQSNSSLNDETQIEQTACFNDDANTECGFKSLGWVMARIGRVSKSIQGHKLWEIENSPIGMGVDDGIPRRMDRLRSLGNAVVPQIPEMIGYAILEAERQAA